jgi:hypothetical protein
MISACEDVVDEKEQGGKETGKKDVPESDVDGIIGSVVDLHDF